MSPAARDEGVTRRRAPGRVVGALALLLMIIASVIGQTTRATPAAARSAAPSRTSVQIRVDDVSPSVVPRSSTPQALRIRVSLTNTTGSTLSDVRVLGFRGEPIGNQKALDAAMTEQDTPTDGYPIAATSPVRVTLPAGGTVSAVFATTISILNDDSGLCQCLNAIYPVYLVASVPTASGGRDTLGATATYLPSQVQGGTKTEVSWVWPLIDRPHRLEGDTEFFDDDLAASVASGRLDRALRVVEGLRPVTPITLVVDPDLLDELEVMATGKYTVRAVNSTSDATAGTGAVAAQTWLARFAAVLKRGSVQISLTPYADPDIQALTTADLTWSTELPGDMARRVTAALAGREPSTDIAWPAGGSVGEKALAAMAASGVQTAVVDSSALSPATRDSVPVALAKIRTSAGTVAAAATSPAMQRQVATALDAAQTTSPAANALPYLIAEIAVRAVQSDNGSGGDTSAVLTPPRYVDPDPTRAIRTIEDTSSNAYATPIALRSLREHLPTSTSALRRQGSATSTVRVPASDLAAAAHTTQTLPTVSSLLNRDPDARSLLAGLARAQQRIVSSAWRQTTQSPFDRNLGPALAGALDDQLSTLRDGVRIVTPDGTSYTLGSDDSSLPITIENALPYTVEVNVVVAAQDGLPGYSMRSIGAQRIAANGKQTVQVPSHLERSGRIRVDATLKAPTGSDALGDPVLLYVRSTEFGTIGVVITVVAGGVLALALLVRFGRRLQRLRRKSRVPADRTARPAETRIGTGTS